MAVHSLHGVLPTGLLTPLPPRLPSSGSFLVGMRNTCSDWSSGQEPMDDPYMKGCGHGRRT
jgi:hypothetical protein